MSKNIRLAVLSLIPSLIILQICGCQPAEKAHAKPHWGYSGDTGPEHWGDLSPDYILAKTGKQQSPIDITNSEPAQGKLSLNYRPTTLDLVNNGHAIQINCKKGSILKSGDTTYELKQLHFHSPSEHTINGKHFDMEGHLVHVSDSGSIAVVGLLFQKGKENSFLKQFWSKLPEEADGNIKDESLILDINDVLPTDKSCYVYDGSLTTPPCTEGVKWYVLSKPLEMSEMQFDQFQKFYKGNFRPVQPINGRTIQMFK